MARPRLLFLVTEDWFFLSFRLDLARAARDAGYQVIVATRVGEMRQQIEKENFQLEPLRWKRRNLNPFGLLADIVAISRLYRRLRPDIVHHVSLKPIGLGSLAALFAPRVPVVNTLSGLGYTFTARTLRARVLAKIVSLVLAPLLRRPATVTIAENEDDRRFLVEQLGVPAEQTANLGAGIELARFEQMPLPGRDPITIACVARMLAIKGIEDLVAASRILRARGVGHRIVLAGAPDPENPGAIAQTALERWAKDDGVIWLGPVADIRTVWRQADIAAQPSLGGEGLPKSLMEAAACGRPLVVTDVPGCREIARAGVNAILVPPRTPSALADAIERLIRDAPLRERFAAESRRIALAEFSLERTVAATIALHGDLLQRAKG
jgi:glycosyltransferase involved in cell wall biosynthesis